jgi:hypothetical protein
MQPVSDMLSRFFKKPTPKTGSDTSAPAQEELLIVPVPSLVAVLLALAEEKRRPLTEGEVTGARDGCACIAMPVSAAAKVIEGRGYNDLNPENIWEEWQVFLGAEEWRNFQASKEKS